jgi:hypothetical protein
MNKKIVQIVKTLEHFKAILFKNFFLFAKKTFAARKKTFSQKIQKKIILKN